MIRKRELFSAHHLSIYEKESKRETPSNETPSNESSQKDSNKHSKDIMII